MHPLIVAGRFGDKFAYDIVKNIFEGLPSQEEMESKDYDLDIFGKLGQEWQHYTMSHVDYILEHHIDTQGHTLFFDGMDDFTKISIIANLVHVGPSLKKESDDTYVRKPSNEITCLHCIDCHEFIYSYQNGVPKITLGRSPCTSEHIYSYQINVPTLSQTLAFSCCLRDYTDKKLPQVSWPEDFDITTYVPPPPISFYHSMRKENEYYLKNLDMAWIYSGGGDFYVYEVGEGWEVRRSLSYQNKVPLGTISTGSPRWLCLLDGEVATININKKFTPKQLKRYNPVDLNLNVASSSVKVDIPLLVGEKEDLLCKIRPS